jgi:hypothetical protein
MRMSVALYISHYPAALRYYAMWNETFAMIVIRVCSLMVNGPGFKVHSAPKAVTLCLGMYFAQKLQMGYATNWAIRVDTLIEGARIEKRTLRPEPKTANKLPITQTLTVS